MRRIFITALSTVAFLLIAYSAFPQSKFRADISMGVVSPLGDFKKSDINLATSGYATSGFTLNAEANYSIYKDMALSLRFHFGNAPLDKNKFEAWFDNKLGSYITEPDSVNYAINFWQWATPLLGIKYSLPIIKNKVFFDGGLFSGVSFNQIPDQGLTFNDTENKKVLVSENTDETTLSASLAATAALRFRISSNVELKIEASYFGTTISYNHASYLVTETDVVEISTARFEIPVKTIDTTIGLVYWL
jgi:hypothetical protein